MSTRTSCFSVFMGYAKVIDTDVALHLAEEMSEVVRRIMLIGSGAT